MSGQDLVSDLRESGKPLRAEGGGVRPLDVLLAVIAFAAIASLTFYGVTGWQRALPPQGPASPPALSAPAIATAQAPAWSTDDTVRCQSQARAAADDPLVPEGAMPPNPVVARGFAGMATMLECRLATNPNRLCDPTERATMVSAVNDYLGRADLVIAGLGVEGAPMKLMGGLLGGEAAAGSDIFEMERDSTLRLMGTYDAKVATAFRRLVRDGLLAKSDFAGFMGIGLSTGVTRLFGAVAVEREVCGGA